jgi:hypothetical protein
VEGKSAQVQMKLRVTVAGRKMTPGGIARDFPILQFGQKLHGRH